MSSIVYCNKCLFPSTKPDLFLNDGGICDACLSAESKHGIHQAVDWTARAAEFESLIERIRSRPRPFYDCVVPVSGGKDSTWQVYAAKRLHGLHPLAVTFDQFDQTSSGRDNLEVLKDIGVDHLHFSLNPLVVKKLVKKGFEVIGDPYWVNHVGTFSVPFTVAKRFDIPLIIYGENPQFEYGGPEHSRDERFMDHRWRQEFGGMRGFREEDAIDPDLGVSHDDLKILHFPYISQSEPEVQAIFYGYFFKWDVAEHLSVVESLGWRPLPTPPAGSWLTYENCDMRFIDIRERIKFLKYGYGRATDQLNIEIRAGRISRSEALQIAKEIDGKVSEENIRDFCELIEISREAFDATIDSFVNEEIFFRTDCGDWDLRLPRE